MCPRARVRLADAARLAARPDGAGAWPLGLVLNDGTALADGKRLLDVLESFGTVLAIKLYRLGRGPGPDVPYIPCLDHEAMLHEHVQRHGSVYVQETASGDLHEIVFISMRDVFNIDTV